MDFATRSGEGRDPNEEALVERLRQILGGFRVFNHYWLVLPCRHNAEEQNLAHKTFDDYARCLRFIVSELRSMIKPRSRHDYRNGGHKAWAASVDATPLQELTADKIRAWNGLM